VSGYFVTQTITPKVSAINVVTTSKNLRLKRRGAGYSMRSPSVADTAQMIAAAADTIKPAIPIAISPSRFGWVRAAPIKTTDPTAIHESACDAIEAGSRVGLLIGCFAIRRAVLDSLPFYRA
jgi:hypothetical protein